MAKTYRVTGTFKMGDRWAHFANEVHTDSSDGAKERILSEFGSRHHLNRRQIKIEKVEEVKQSAAGEPGR